MTWLRFTGPTFGTFLYRAKVPGGWLVCSAGDSGRDSPGVAFLPDPSHKWDPDD